MAFFYAPPPPSQSNSATATNGTPPYNTVQDGSASQPPFRQVQAALAMAVVLAAWPASGGPRLQAPNNQQVKIAPLTLAYGDQPATVGPITPSEYAQVRLTWENPWSAQHAAPLKPPSVDQPVPQASLTPTEQLIVQSWPTGWGEPQRLATLVQTTGNQPPINGPITSSEYAQIRTAWESTGSVPQGPPKSAAAIPPPIVQTVQPYVRPFMGQPLVPWVQPPTLADTAPLTCQAVGLPAHDEFSVNYSTSLGPCNWTQTAGQFGTDGLGHALGLNSGSNLAFWKETAFSPDQYCQVTVSTYGFDDPGPCVRVSPSGNDSYAMVADQASSNITLYQTIAGVGTPIQSVGSITCSNGDVLKLQVVGSTLKMFVNAVQIGTDQVDTGITTGQPGLFLNRAGATRTLLDNFLADNIGAPAADTVLSRPTGWINPGIFAAAFAEPQIEVVDTFASIPQQFPICDDFHRPDGSLGSNWTTSNGALAIVSNQATTAATAFNLAFWNANVFSADQGVQATVFYNVASSFTGPAARVSSGGNGYLAVGSQSGAGQFIELHKYVATVDTTLTTFSGLTLADGDIIRLDARGTLLTVSLNGSVVGTFTDSTFATGQPGIFIFQTGSAISKWCADNLAPIPPSGDTVLAKPTGWINAGIWNQAFAEPQIEVVDALVSLPGDAVDQPPRQRPISLANLTARQAWILDWSAQRRPVTVTPSAITPPIPQGPLSATKTQILVSQWVQTWPAQRARNMTATLPTGTRPIGVKPISNANLGALVNQWIQTWPAQFVKPVRDINAPPPTFRPEWAVNSNQIVGPIAPEPETH